MPIQGYHKPIPVSQKLNAFAHDTLEAILQNCRTQGIFPAEVYPGYREKNARAGDNSWKSTGASYDSFYFQVMDATVHHAQVDFFYDYYLNFVDMGVGRGRPIEKVNRTLAADRDIRYMEWNAQEGSTQRPAIAMEFRHQSTRLQKYFANRYKYDVQCIVVKGLEGTFDQVDL